MKIAKLMKPGDIQILEVPLPQITEDQVLLKIKCFGICGSDIQIYHGKHKHAHLPQILGHELAAVIERKGSSVKDFNVGDKVTMEPLIYCGKCIPCKQGRYNVCEQMRVFGVYQDGCNCEYMAIESKYLHKVPSDMPDEEVALVEPFAVGLGSVKRSRFVSGGNVAIIGAGTIGNFTAQAAKLLGAKKVLVMDINEQRLEYARECGVDVCVNTSSTSIQDAIEIAFGDEKASVIIDCAAVPSLFPQILEAARPNSDIVFTGNYKSPVELYIPSIQRREISLIGHMMYVHDDFEDAIKLLYEKKIRTDKTITHRFTMDNYAEAFRLADTDSKDIMKMMVIF